MPRARDLGISVGCAEPGPANAITDVPGVLVGHETLIDGDGELRVGSGPVRTGVTVIRPRSANAWERPVFAGSHRLNGNGEISGLDWVRECGVLSSPIALTNTHSLGVVRDALIGIEAKRRDPRDLFWRLPVVGETWDGVLNDINGAHVRFEHVETAFERARPGAVREGAVGGGTGMVCHGFKGGIGTASRRAGTAPYTVGVLVQANHGRRERLRVNGIPVGTEIDTNAVPEPCPSTARAFPGGGSIICVIACDAPLLPHQCTRLAQRAGLGVGRTGGTGEHYSGDLFVAFATGNEPTQPDLDVSPDSSVGEIAVLAEAALDPLFDAVIEATEEAILNALLAAETMTGRDGLTAYGLEADRLLGILGAAGYRNPS